MDFFFPFRVRARFLGATLHAPSGFVGWDGSGAKGTLGFDPSVSVRSAFLPFFESVEFSVGSNTLAAEDATNQLQQVVVVSSLP